MKAHIFTLDPRADSASARRMLSSIAKVLLFSLDPRAGTVSLQSSKSVLAPTFFLGGLKYLLQKVDTADNYKDPDPVNQDLMLLSCAYVRAPYP